jgi:predicted house-cleaning noncanonical NTP pyrophosphatase (MazG superfamily)
VNATGGKLAQAALLMQRALTESTGLKDLQQKLVIYWTLATHSLPHVNTFSLLAIQGKMGTGKSQALSVIGNFSFRPVRFSLRGMTAPAIRDKFAEAHNRTAVIEEADSAWKDPDSTFECLLSDRYQKASAVASHKVPRGDKGWIGMTKEYFGATILHRRVSFKDAALDGRTVCVRTRPDHTRQFREYNAEDPWNAEGKELVSEITFEPPEVEQPQGVAGRIFNTYKPLLSTAKLCGDEEFAQQLQAKLQQETLELREAQSSEPDGLVLQAIVEIVLGTPNVEFRNIKFRELTQSIWDNHRFSLSPRQIGPIARDLGFETKPSHGVTVVVPTPATLLRACEECEYTDEAIEELRRGLYGPVDAS